MITTVTPNVSIDKKYLVDTLQPGSVMRVLQCTATAGGKGLNVARVAAALGAPVRASGFVGGFTGQYVQQLLGATPGVQQQFMPIQGETRSCINIIDEQGTSTEFLEPGPLLTEGDVDGFLKFYWDIAESSQVITLSGSLPRGCPRNYYETLVRIAKDMHKQVILDSSGEAMLLGLQAGPTLIKPNREELAVLYGPLESDKALAKAAVQLHKTGVAYVVVSLGKRGAVMACGQGVYFAPAPKVAVVNTVGCGDAMVGALAVGLAQGLEAQALLAYGVEVSSASAMNPDTGGFSAKDFEAVRGSCQVQRWDDVE